MNAEGLLPRQTSTDEDAEFVILAYFISNPIESIRTAKAHINISFSSVHRIIKNNIFHNFKRTNVRDIHPQDATCTYRPRFFEMILIRF